MTRIALWNVRTPNESGKLRQLIKEMDILGLTEVGLILEK
jgi:hypothetical protein